VVRKFKWKERIPREAKRHESTRGWRVFERLLRGSGDTRAVRDQTRWPIAIQSGIGNLERSPSATFMGSPEIWASWEKCMSNGVIREELPWTCVSVAARRRNAMTRAHTPWPWTGRGSSRKLPRTIGGKPEQYEVADERVFRKGGARA